MNFGGLDNSLGGPVPEHGVAPAIILVSQQVRRKPEMTYPSGRPTDDAVAMMRYDANKK